MRYQQEAVVAAAAAAATGGKPPGVGPSLSRAASDAALALGGQLVGGAVLPSLLAGGAEDGVLQPAEEAGIQAVPNLSNRCGRGAALARLGASPGRAHLAVACLEVPPTPRHTCLCRALDGLPSLTRRPACWRPSAQRALLASPLGIP